MAEPVEINDVLQVTGLTPATPAEPEPAPPAASPPEAVTKPAEQPAAAEEVEATSTAQTPDAPEEEVSRGTEPAEMAGEAPKKPSRGVQKALDRLTERAVKAETQAQQVSSALAAVLQQIQNQRQPETRPAQPVQAEQPPDRSKFADWEAFNRATAQWEARQASTQVVRQELGNFVRALAGQQAQVTAQAQSQALMGRLDDARAKGPERFADWHEKVVASDAPMTAPLLHAITISEDPALVMHHLGVHPEEHAKLLTLSPDQINQQIGRIVASAQPQAVISRAPPPAKPIAGNKAGVGSSQYTDSMTPEQHKAFMARNGLNRGIR